MQFFWPLFSTFSVAYGCFIERHRLERLKLDISSPYIPDSFDGYRILHLSDLHLDFFSTRWRLKNILSKLKRVKPDLLFFTGDCIGKKLSELNYFLKCLNFILPDIKKIYVLGNHEHRLPLQKVSEIIEKNRTVLLINQNITLTNNSGQHLNILGLDSKELTNPLFKTLCQNLNPSHFNIVLAHTPDILPFLDLDRVDLLLFGHTHGGQIQIPFIDLPNIFRFTPYKFMKGVHKNKRTTILINNGLGVSNFPARFMSPPQIPELHLHREV
ncbi:metallophosphoesterase [Candidatus Riflebacteria bacterium]